MREVAAHLSAQPAAQIAETQRTNNKELKRSLSEQKRTGKELVPGDEAQMLWCVQPIVISGSYLR